MSKCVRCGKHKLFMKLQDGLCPDCFRAVAEQMAREASAHANADLRPRRQEDKPQKEKTPEPVEENGGKIRVPFADHSDDIFDDIERLNSPAYSPPSPEEQAAWEAEAIARSNAFQQRLQSEFDRIQWDVIQKIQPGEPEPLTDIEALFLDYIDNRSTSPFKVGGYWVHDYHLDLNQEMQKYFRSGYLQFASISFSLSKTTVPELKKILSSHQLKVSGKKAELIQRILENIPEEDLQVYAYRHIQLTESGRKVADEHQYLSYFFREPFKSYISLSQASDLRRMHPEYPVPKLTRELLYPLLEKEQKEKNWAQYRSILHSIYLTFRTEKDDKSALRLLLQIQLLDALGYDDRNIQDPEAAFYAPGIVGDIAGYLDTLPETDLKDELSKAAEALPVLFAPKEIQMVYTGLLWELKNQRQK